MNPKLITLSFGDCPVKPKCAMCYLETLKENNDKTIATKWSQFVKTSIDINLPNNDLIYININKPDDFVHAEQVYLKYLRTYFHNINSPMLLNNTYYVCPIDMLDMHWYFESRIKPKFIATINTFMKSHQNILFDRNIKKNLVNLLENVNMGYEVSFNSSSLFKEDIVQATADLLDKLKFNNEDPKYGIILNYVQTNNQTKMSDVYEKLGQLAFYLGPCAKISGCVEAHKDALNVKKHCEVSDIYDFIDGYMMSNGCPWHAKMCEGN